MEIERTIITLRTIFEQRGDQNYGNESVTQLQHALQCASLAEEENVGPQLISAALIHDIGHILDANELPEENELDLDDKHEHLGYEWLFSRFGPAVADPVKLHVAAKRYLCTKNPFYQETLSPTSYKSFLDQGGIMSDTEIEIFENEPFNKEAVQLRIWDDKAKDPFKKTPTYSHFETYLELALKIHKVG